MLMWYLAFLGACIIIDLTNPPKVKDKKKTKKKYYCIEEEDDE